MSAPSSLILQPSSLTVLDGGLSAPDPAHIYATHIESQEHDDYFRRPATHQRKIGQKLACMALIEHALGQGTSLRVALKDTAAHAKGHGWEKCSLGTLRNLWPVWKSGGHKPGKSPGEAFAPRDWHLFAPAWNPGKDRGLPEAFVQYVIEEAGRYTRDDSVEALFARVCDAWKRDEHIPGYGKMSAWCAAQGRPLPAGPFTRAGDLPYGWSAGTFRRILKTRVSKASLTLTRRGEFQAHNHYADTLQRDVTNLRPFEWLTVDDHEFDCAVVMIVGGKAQVVRPVGLFLQDIRTRAIVHHFIGGRFTRPSDDPEGRGGKKATLTGADMRYLLLSFLRQWGLPRGYPITLIQEMATARVNLDDRRRFDEAFPGHFTWEETGTLSGALFPGGFEQSGGRPWLKGWIEAFFRPLETALSCAPGALARRYDLYPGDHKARAQEAVQTLDTALARGVDPSLMQLPLLRLEEFILLVDEMVTRLNWRTRHEMRGLGRVHEYECAPGKYLRDTVPEEAALIPVGAALSTRREAPIECLARLLHQQGPAPEIPHVMNFFDFYPTQKAKRIRAGKIAWKLTDKAEDTLLFRDGEAAPWLAAYEGQEVRCALEEDLTAIHVQDAQGTWLGTVARQLDVDVTDRAAMGRAMQRVHRGHQQDRAEAATTLEPQRRELAAARAHNAEVLSLNPAHVPARDPFTATARPGKKATGHRSPATKKPSPFAAAERATTHALHGDEPIA